MNRTEIWAYSSPIQNGQSLFRAIIGKVNDLNLSLCIIKNDKKIKELGEELRTVLREKETKKIKDLRVQLEKTNEPDQKEVIIKMINSEWNAFTSTKEIKEWFAEDSGIELSKCTLSKKYVDNAKFDIDQIEVLMMFTNIAELGEETEPEKAKKGKK